MDENSASNLGDETPHISGDPGRARYDEGSPSYVKPIIKELVRTQVCFPNIKLLVDKISIVKIPSTTESSSLEAYLMYLTDREKTIQAVVKRRLHKWLTTFDVREGSYVVLKEYNLEKGKRLRGEGEVFYLAISDFYSIGEEQRYDADTDLRNVSRSPEGDSPGPLDQMSARNEDEDEDESNGIGMRSTERSLPMESSAEAHHTIGSSRDSSAFKLEKKDPKKRKRGTTSLDLDPDLPLLAGKADEVRETPSTKSMRRQARDDAQPRSPDEPSSRTSISNIPLSQKDPTKARVSAERSQSPLQLSTLASITGIYATRNKQVNILAMIEYVSSSTVKPTTAPLKRDVRIVDPSTDRKVTLSIFIDPVNFVPMKYDIILFRDLTTHDFSGGNLNAYPKKCRGKEWYVVNPYDFKECDMKSMEVFRANYRKTKAQEPR